ncbi:response regulator transcription factor [Halobaculum sp. MBLA0147]|uniref:response regulator transcription factor n=1 Tax=Halobaculum sp. MBLA0147 TaxID=3079934 RepID=UPI0035255134
MTDGPSVLVVEDEVEMAETYAAWLRDEYDVQTAHDGREALAVASDAVDVVLLDRLMPRLSGDEALDRLRARGYDLRVAMVTAVEPDATDAELPFDTYLTKPVDETAVRETVATLASLAEYDEAVREAFVAAERRAALETATETSIETAAHADTEPRVRSPVEGPTEPTDGDTVADRLDDHGETLTEAHADASDRLGDVDHDTVAAALSGLSANVRARYGSVSSR